MKNILESVTKVKDISSTVSLLEVTLSSHPGVKFFTCMNFSEALMLVNADIEFCEREDIIEGNIERVITDISIRRVVQTLAAEDNIKLYSEDTRPNKSDMKLKDIAANDTHYNALVYCVSSSFHSSSKSNYCLLNIVDMDGRRADLYVFDEFGGEREDKYGGKYIYCHITKTAKGYFQAPFIEVESEEERVLHPEIFIALKYLEKVIESDEVLKDFVTATDFFDKLMGYTIEGEIERGYILTKLACEVRLASIMNDITPVLSREILIRGLFASKAYVLTDCIDNVRSLSLQSILNAARYTLGKDPRIQNILEEQPKKILVEKKVISDIINMINLTTSVRFNITDYLLADDYIWKPLRERKGGK